MDTYIKPKHLKTLKLMNNICSFLPASGLAMASAMVALPNASVTLTTAAKLPAHWCTVRATLSGKLNGPKEFQNVSKMISYWKGQRFVVCVVQIFCPSAIGFLFSKLIYPTILNL